MRWVFISPPMAPNSREVFVLEGLSILLIHQENEYFAIENLCSHESFPLEEGAISGHKITCPYHGATFCLRTGEVLSPPAFDKIKSFPIRVINGLVEVQLD